MKRLFLLLLAATSVCAQTRISGSGTVKGSATLPVVQQTSGFAIGWNNIPNTDYSTVCPSATTFPLIQLNEGCSAIVNDWAGGAADPVHNRLLFSGGGHNGNADNSIYSLNIGTSPGTTTVTRLSGPSYPPVNNDGLCHESNPDNTPTARHNYSGLAYIAARDELYSNGGSLNYCGSPGTGGWTFNFGTNSWTQVQNNVTAALDQMACYDPNSANVFVQDGNYSPPTSFWKYDTLAQTYTALHADSGGPGPGNGYGVCTVDPDRQLFIMFAAGGIWHVDISAGSAFALVSDGAPASCATALANQGPGVTYDTDQALVAVWSGGNTVSFYNPTTKTCTTQTFANGPGAQVTNGTYGRFQYFPALHVYGLVNTFGQNAWVLKIADYSQNVITTRSFASRCASTTGLIRCSGLDTQAVITANSQFTNDLGESPFVDLTTFATAPGSMRIHMPPLNGQQFGILYLPLSQATGNAGGTLGPPGFGAALNKLYFQTRIRQSFPDSLNLGGEGHKYFGFGNLSTCQNVGLVWQNNNTWGFPTGFVDCGLPMWNDISAGSMVEQGDFTNCLYNTFVACAFTPANTWRTYYTKVIMNSWSSIPGCLNTAPATQCGGGNNDVEAWVSSAGQPLKQFIKLPTFGIKFDNTTADVFDHVTLFPYTTQRDNTITEPDENMWWDDVIVSGTPICPPDGPSPDAIVCHPDLTQPIPGNFAFYDNFTGTTLSSAWTSLTRRPDTNENACLLPANTSVSGGMLNILTKVQSTSCSWANPDTDHTVVNNSYTSSNVQWSNFNFLYGTLTVRWKAGGCTGCRPIVWMLGAACQSANLTTPNNFGGCNWPNAGSEEIDVMEIGGTPMTTALQNLFAGSTTPLGSCVPSFSDASQNFHTVQLVWTVGKLVWKIDGATTCTVTDARVPSTPQFLILATDTGNNQTVVNGTLPVTTMFDYVAVTQP